MNSETSKNINIYCDESRHTNQDDSFMVIGALSCHRDNKEKIYKSIYSIQKMYNTWSEFGWKTISPNRKDFYWDLMAFFVSENDLFFRCITADKRLLNHDLYNHGDSELGFYKLYYQMLIHWLQSSYRHYIYLDWQQNQDRNRFAVLRDILRRKLTGKAKIVCLEPISSKDSPLIQLTDLLIGAIGYAWNGKTNSQIKTQFCQDLANRVNLPALNVATKLSARKFNIFNFLGH